MFLLSNLDLLKVRTGAGDSISLVGTRWDQGITYNRRGLSVILWLLENYMLLKQLQNRPFICTLGSFSVSIYQHFTH